MHRHEEAMRPYPSESSRQAEPVDDSGFLRIGLERLEASFGRLATAIGNRSRKVDERRQQSLSGETTSLVPIIPDWEFSEIITSVIVSGPPATLCTVQLGNRSWQITTPATGILVIAPVQISLGRDDVRQLSSGTAGNWGLELMGYCDTAWTA